MLSTMNTVTYTETYVQQRCYKNHLNTVKQSYDSLNMLYDLTSTYSQVTVAATATALWLRQYMDTLIIWV